ncbi:hypothetical protein EXIGLDRAFT_681062 [Exidia glandulosa HHB12029]|uniref:Uncharacterized protein n=1 Tax=Exidia glandulosa HHB12029 TaxID=1314781 RepID=A0A165E9G0_EXIGL|nr:hypothetical protein EXIGLDRAFT_681062 [Exidia glandulosa HHB12029]
MAAVTLLYDKRAPGARKYVQTRIAAAEQSREQVLLQLTKTNDEVIHADLAFRALADKQRELNRQLSMLDHELRRHRQILSPVSILPDDVMSYIFDSHVEQCAMDFVWRHSRDPTTHHAQLGACARFALAVASVCRSWRNIALATPSLWSKIRVVSPSHITDTKTRCFLRTVLARSKRAPLHLYLSSLNPDDIGSCGGFREIFSLLLDQASRWRVCIVDAIELGSSDNFLPLFFQMPTPLLEYFVCYYKAEFDADGNRGRETPTISMIADAFLQAAPRLRSLTLSTSFIPHVRFAQIPSVEELTLIGYPLDPAHWRSLACSFPSICRIVLDGGVCTEYTERITASQTSAVVFPKVTSLLIKDQSYMLARHWPHSSILSFPALRSLDLHDYDSDDGYHDMLVYLVKDSRLESLIVGCHEGIGEGPVLCRFLRHLPHLESLSLHKFPLCAEEFCSSVRKGWRELAMGRLPASPDLCDGRNVLGRRRGRPGVTPHLTHTSAAVLSLRVSAPC